MCPVWPPAAARPAKWLSVPWFSARTLGSFPCLCCISLPGKGLARLLCSVTPAVTLGGSPRFWRAGREVAGRAALTGVCHTVPWKLDPTGSSAFPSWVPDVSGGRDIQGQVQRWGLSGLTASSVVKRRSRFRLRQETDASPGCFLVRSWWLLPTPCSPLPRSRSIPWEPALTAGAEMLAAFWLRATEADSSCSESWALWFPRSFLRHRGRHLMRAPSYSCEHHAEHRGGVQETHGLHRRCLGPTGE